LHDKVQPHHQRVEGDRGRNQAKADPVQRAQRVFGGRVKVAHRDGVVSQARAMNAWKGQWHQDGKMAGARFSKSASERESQLGCDVQMFAPSHKAKVNRRVIFMVQSKRERTVVVVEFRASVGLPSCGFLTREGAMVQGSTQQGWRRSQ
jgi:hypothetical protein